MRRTCQNVTVYGVFCKPEDPWRDWRLVCVLCCWDESRVFILSMHKVFPKGNAAGVGEQTGFAIVCWGLKENMSCLRQ